MEIAYPIGKKILFGLTFFFAGIGTRHKQCWRIRARNIIQHRPYDGEIFVPLVKLLELIKNHGCPLLSRANWVMGNILIFGGIIELVRAR